MNSKFDVLPLFSTPIYISSIDIDLPIVDDIKNTEVYRMSSNTGWISEDTQLLDHEEFKNLRKSLSNCIDSYIHEVLHVNRKIQPVITTSWLTIHDKGDFAPMHEHANSLFSGVCYIECPRDDESVLLLETPNKHNIFPTSICPVPTEFNLFNSNQWQMKPEVGSVYIFPSSVLHATTPCTSESKRYCLAFNVFLKGQITDDSSTLKNPINKLILK